MASIPHQQRRHFSLGGTNFPVLQLQLLLVLTVLLGGGGVAYGLNNLIIQLCALAIFALNPCRVRQFVQQAPRMLVALVAITIALPLIQIVPLPSAIWQAFPGREPVIESLSLAGFPTDSWQPWSMDRARSLVAFCGTLAPAAIIVIGSTLGREEKRRLVWTAALSALAAFIWGVVQLTSANSVGMLYPVNANPGVLYANFANRNSTGLFFVLVLVMLACLPLRGKGLGLLAPSIVGALLALGVVLTQSRTSIVLLLVVVGFVVLRSLFVFLSSRKKGSDHINPAVVFAGLAGLLLVVAIGASAMIGGRASDSFSRFTQIGETDRPEMWEDGVYAARQYWPLGSGTGTFDEVFQLHESLEYVSVRRAGRAHNDYIELAIESGIVGIAILLGWLIWIARASLVKRSSSGRWMAMGGGLGLLMIALQSLLDYPLRNQTILCVAALLVILLVSAREAEA